MKVKCAWNKYFKAKKKTEFDFQETKEKALMLLMVLSLL